MSDHEAVQRELERQARALTKPTTAQPSPEANGHVPHEVQAQLAPETEPEPQPEPEPEVEPQPESRPAPEVPAGTRTVPEHHQRPGPGYGPQPPPPPAWPSWRQWWSETWWVWVALAVVLLVVGLLVLVLVLGPAAVWWARLLS